MANSPNKKFRVRVRATRGVFLVLAIASSYLLLTIGSTGGLMHGLQAARATSSTLEHETPTNQSSDSLLREPLLQANQTNLLGATKEVHVILNNTSTGNDDDIKDEASEDEARLMHGLQAARATSSTLKHEIPTNQSSDSLLREPLLQANHTNLLGATKEVHVILNNTSTGNDDDSEDEARLMHGLQAARATSSTLKHEIPTNQSSDSLLREPLLQANHTNLLGATKEVHMILNNTSAGNDDDNEDEASLNTNENVLPALTYVAAGEHPLMTSHRHQQQQPVTIVVQLGGELGNHMNKIAGGLCVKHHIEKQLGLKAALKFRVLPGSESRWK
eukprot:scaffold6485_cov108-Cylindrotheca_fusiformis.AAC.3